MLGLGGGPDGCLGGLPTSTPTSSPPHRGMYKEGDRGHLRLPSHTLATAGQSGNFLLLDSGSTEPLGVEENTCLHFHGLDVGLLLFFACGEGRTKGTVAELREWLRGPTVGLSPLPGGRGSANHLVVPVSNSMARQVPSTMLAPRTQGTARAEKGLGGGWRPTSGRRKSRGCGSGPCTVSGTRKGSSTNCPAHFLPVNRAPFPEEGPDCTASPGPGMEHLLPRVGPGGGERSRPTAARLW